MLNTSSPKLSAPTRFGVNICAAASDFAGVFPFPFPFLEVLPGLEALFLFLSTILATEHEEDEDGDDQEEIHVNILLRGLSPQHKGTAMLLTCLSILIYSSS